VLRDRDTDGNGTLDERLYATMDYFNGTAVVNTSGTVLERYAYSAFGIRRIMAADFSPRSTSSYDWGFGFQGQFRDAETGWYNYGYRFYVPLLGRWINRDPIGEDGGVNLYSFSKNSPRSSIDILGLLVSLIYDVTNRKLTVTGDGESFECEDCCTSGTNNPDDSGEKGKGPLPSGDYIILDHPLVDWWSLDKVDGFVDDYDPTTKRGAFRLHTGTISLGCITVTSEECWNKLSALLNNTAREKITESNGKARDKFGTLIVI